MGFAMIGQEMPPECADWTDAEVRTHIEALAWSRTRLLDLCIPKRDLPRFAYSEHALEAVAGLVLRGSWADRGDYWYLAFHPEWQKTREEIEERQESDRVRQARKRAHDKGDHSTCIPGHCPEVSRVTSRVTSFESRRDPREEQSMHLEGELAGTSETRLNGYGHD